MTLERITKNNIDRAVRVQEELFPGESARANYEESLEDESGYEYYLIFEDGVCAGITGLYSYPEDPDSAWLGWFGIREGFRRKHLGSRVLAVFEEMAASRGFRCARLYTDAENNDAAIAFYKANGYTCEPYLNTQDPACLEHKALIFSKSLTSGAPVPWNSRSIHLTEQIAKQKKYSSAGTAVPMQAPVCVGHAAEQNAPELSAPSVNTEHRQDPGGHAMGDPLIAYCGVDCAACPDYAEKKCPGCRGTDWTPGDECMPVACCREKGIDLCGRCPGFPCPDMAAFYEESDSHREAYDRMQAVHGEQGG